jgi:hypothetical protein
VLRTANSGPHGSDESGGSSSLSGTTPIAAGTVSGNSVPSTSNAAVAQDGATVAGPSHASSGTVAGLANILAQSVAATVGGMFQAFRPLNKWLMKDYHACGKWLRNFSYSSPVMNCCFI